MNATYTTWRAQVEHVLNAHGHAPEAQEPEDVLARYLRECLASFDIALEQRARGIVVQPGPPTIPAGAVGMPPTTGGAIFDQAYTQITTRATGSSGTSTPIESAVIKP